VHVVVDAVGVGMDDLCELREWPGGSSPSRQPPNQPGYLHEDVDVTEFLSTTGTSFARGIFGGEVFKDKLHDLDSTAISDLGAKTIVDATGINVLKF